MDVRDRIAPRTRRASARRRRARGHAMR
jgi:hypothetical protein